MSYVDQLERELLRAGNARASQQRVWRLPRVRLGGAAMVLGTASALAVALLVLALVRHAPSPQPTAGAPPAGAEKLFSQLAILRRAQTAADRAHPAALNAPGVIPSLTRLAIDTGGLKVWIAVIDPRTGGPRRWPVQFGDDVAFLARVDGRNYLSLPLPAAALHDPIEVRNAGGWIVQLVPDGVARARWSFPVKTGRFSLYGRAVNNIAFAHLGASAASPVPPTKWFAADGRPAPTTPNFVSRQLAVRRAQAAREARSAATNVHYSISPALVRALPLPATTGDISVNRPGITGLPTGVLEMATGGRTRIDPALILKVTAGDGMTFWVAPGENGLCVFAAESANSRVGTCSPTIAAALAQGARTNLRGADGREWLVGVVPRSRRHVTVQLKSGSTRQVPVVDGIVITPAAGTAGG